ncbi:MAG: helix-turn-helix domain-containing protein [Immundisolibacteraceae bacterium]|nr:helix-turn-helix domain-containing protein [Immundisolibacteraceae bacterium]
MKSKEDTPRQESSPQSENANGNAAHQQRTRILAALTEAGAQGRTTIDMREQLDIMHPSGRIMELREMGYRIETVWTVTRNAQGCQHRCARYVLIRKTIGAVA